MELAIQRYNSQLARRNAALEAVAALEQDADEAMDSDEELSLSHKRTVEKEHLSQIQRAVSSTPVLSGAQGVSPSTPVRHIRDGGSGALSPMLMDEPAKSGSSSKPIQPRTLYRDLYKRHHKIRQNWFLGRYKLTSFPGHAFNVVTCLQFDSEKIVSGSDDHTMHIYDTSSGTLLRRLQGHEGGVWALQYWHRALVSGSTDRSVRVWDMETGQCRHKFDGHTSTVRCLMIVTPVPAENGSGKMEPAVPLIVTGSRDSTLRVWKLPDIEADATYNIEPLSEGSPGPGPNPYFMHVLEGHQSSVRAIAGYGNVLVSGSYDHNVRVWDLTRGTATFCFQGHTEKVYTIRVLLKKVYSVGYSHELKRAASGSMDATVRVWCVKTGTALFTLKGMRCFLFIIGK